LRAVLGWEPQISLEQGLARTYAWIEDCVRARLAAGAAGNGATTTSAAVAD
jgi:nucleoside-diphosphate-sugar epimerase